jgi:hypothetical protein
MLTKEIVSEFPLTCIPPRFAQEYAEYKMVTKKGFQIEVTIEDNGNSYVEVGIEGNFLKVSANDHHSLHRLIQILS